MKTKLDHAPNVSLSMMLLVNQSHVGVSHMQKPHIIWPFL